MKQKNYMSIDPIKIESDQMNDSYQIVQLQLKMATSSINHEYARIEYDDTACPERQEELLSFMEECRRKYTEARDSLKRYDPFALEQFEEELAEQKRSTRTYDA